MVDFRLPSLFSGSDLNINSADIKPLNGADLIRQMASCPGFAAKVLHASCIVGNRKPPPPLSTWITLVGKVACWEGLSQLTQAFLAVKNALTLLQSGGALPSSKIQVSKPEPTTPEGLSLHCALLLDQFPPEEPPGSSALAQDSCKLSSLHIRHHAQWEMP